VDHTWQIRKVSFLLTKNGEKKRGGRESSPPFSVEPRVALQHCPVDTMVEKGIVKSKNPDKLSGLWSTTTAR